MMTTKDPLGLYIHIPFCVQRCSYCDFLTFANLGQAEIGTYVDGLLRQMAAWGGSKDNLDNGRGGSKLALDTVYIGGGSPSFIDGIYIEKIMEAVNNNFEILEESEITIEANPESMSRDKLNLYKKVGINRLSIGVQSMDDGLLKMLGRAHDKDMFLKKYKLARDTGFDNISLDLIFALPGQTLQAWEDTLRQVIDLGPDHISFYALQIEEGTKMKCLIDEGQLTAIDEETDRAMYHKALEILEANGYIHYEMSNSAKPGYQSRHNLKYWSMDDYLAIGIGAHSYLAGSRYENISDMEAFVKASKKEDFWASAYKNTSEDNRAEYMFTGLRKLEGIDPRDFEKRYGQRPEVLFKTAIEKNLEAGLLQIEKNRIKLSKKGMDLFNTVLVDFV